MFADEKQLITLYVIVHLYPSNKYTKMKLINVNFEVVTM